jgi:hypothetical protein
MTQPQIGLWCQADPSELTGIIEDELMPVCECEQYMIVFAR